MLFLVFFFLGMLFLVFFFFFKLKMSSVTVLHRYFVANGLFFPATVATTGNFDSSKWDF